MGGEKPFLFYGGSSDSGLPPHGRGKDVLILDGAGVVGITPAWAGKSRECRYALTNEWDHPRMGGEKTVKVPALVVPTGSPPRRRGKGS